MTVKELIVELQKYDESLTVICAEAAENCSPAPRLIKHDFTCGYWDDNNRPQHIPRNQEFVIL